MQFYGLFDFYGKYPKVFNDTESQKQMEKFVGQIVQQTQRIEAANANVSARSRQGGHGFA